MAKRKTLEELSLSDTEMSERTVEPKTDDATGKRRKHTSLYLSEPVRRQLRAIAFHEEVKQHDLLIEAVDLLFKSRGAASIGELTGTGE
ncbi:MAG: ribbon-helix-helix domain-containing protein [Pyrinomonadaceae bacterium]